MNFVIKFWIANLIFLNFSFACKLKYDLVSLSGPVNYYLEKINLISDEKLKAVSLFHDFLHLKYKGQWLGGGIYLSESAFKKIESKGFTLILDESFELKRKIKKIEKKMPRIKKIIWVDTKLDSRELVERSKDILIDLSENCEENITAVDKYINKVLKKITNHKFQNISHHFYLGVINKTKPRNMMISNDLFIKILKKNSSIKLFPSKLKYFQPASKLLKNVNSKKTFGLSNSKKNKFEFRDFDKGTYNLFFPGLLTPGLSQYYFIDKFLDFYEAVLK